MRQLIKGNERLQKNHNDLFSPGTSLSHKYKSVRERTESLCASLKTEDYVVQSMPDVSPAKWHLAHTSWFFETFILKQFDNYYKDYNTLYNYLFNSYYVQIGPRFIRSERGLLSRPTVEEVYEYRSVIDRHMLSLIDKLGDQALQNITPVIELGLNHEQQHQELILTDIKHVFSLNPLNPIYIERDEIKANIPELEWISFEGDLYLIGHDQNGFAFDNETPKHREYIEPFQLASRLITNGEYLEFINSGGYEKPELWLSDGWAAVLREAWKAPLYWQNNEGDWEIFTLNGLKKLNLSEPVYHVSLFEADAFARWKNCRLPSESEWEVASLSIPIEGNFLEDSNFHPLPAEIDQNQDNKILQLFGDLWEWTRSSYSAYPGYKIPTGAIGEYNGKFMSGQMVLRGGSCLTPRSHIRKTYRNFFPPNARWQFTGIRLAKDGK